jgi:predicted O-methyltransferase YrrM
LIPNLIGFYALQIHMPLSGLSRKWRRFSRRIRGKEAQGLQQVRLPTVSWRELSSGSSVRVVEARKANGNVRLSEVAILNSFAQAAEDGANIFEIGTFDGRTTLNLAFSSPPRCQVYTLDLKPEMDTAFDLAEGERHMVEKPRSGARIDRYRNTHSAAVSRIHQLYGDSASFDFSPYYGTCSLVFIDASHAYEYVLSDSRAALKMIKPGGVILWHDYGIWSGVTDALEHLAANEMPDIRCIQGTSLAFWRSRKSTRPADAD